MFQWILTSSTESPHPFLERHKVNVWDQGKRARESEREAVALLVFLCMWFYKNARKIQSWINRKEEKVKTRDGFHGIREINPMGTWILSSLWRLHCPSTFFSLFHLCSILSRQICLPGTLFETFDSVFYCFVSFFLYRLSSSFCLHWFSFLMFFFFCLFWALFTWLNHIGFSLVRCFAL